MSATSASPPTDRPQTLERLIGVRSSQPSFYAAWRENSQRLDRSIETLQHISAALCAASEGPGALCEAVVAAAAHHFAAPWAGIMFAGEDDGEGPLPVIRRPRGRGNGADPALGAASERLLDDVAQAT